MLATAGSDDGARCHQRVQTRSSPHKVVVGLDTLKPEMTTKPEMTRRAWGR